LPNPAQVHVLKTLVTEPEPVVSGKIALTLNHSPAIDPRNNHDQGDKKNIDTKPLAFEFHATDGRANKQAGSQPGGRYPEYPELSMPRAGYRIRYPSVNWYAIETVTLDTVVSRNYPQHHLEQKQTRHGPEVLDDRHLGREGLE